MRPYIFAITSVKRYIPFPAIFVKHCANSSTGVLLQVSSVALLSAEQHATLVIASVVNIKDLILED